MNRTLSAGRMLLQIGEADEKKVITWQNVPLDTWSVTKFAVPLIQHAHNFTTIKIPRLIVAFFTYMLTQRIMAMWSLNHPPSHLKPHRHGKQLQVVITRIKFDL